MAVVGTSTSATAIWRTTQRKCFFANGRFWVFYSDGTNIVFRTSIDGITWTEATIVRAGTDGRFFSVWFDGTYIHYAFAAETAGTALFYRRGTQNVDGTITWSAAEQTAVAAVGGTYYRNPFVAVDSGRYPWIGYVIHDGVNQRPWVTKSSTKDGTWTTDEAKGFLYQFSTASDTDWMVSVTPLTNQKVLALYAYRPVAFKAKRWNGSAWDTEATGTSQTECGSRHSAVAEGDDVHLVFIKAAGYDGIYTKYIGATNSFSAETTLYAGISSSITPVISKDDSNNLYVFWLGNPTANHVYYRKYNGASWEDPVDWIDESAEGFTSANRLTCFYSQYYAYIGLLYMTKTVSPYNIKFTYLKFEVPEEPTPQIVTIEDSITTLVRLLDTNMRLVKDDESVGKVYVSKGWFDRDLMKTYDAQVTVGLGGSLDRKIGFSGSKRLTVDSPRVNVWSIEKSGATESGRRIRDKMRQEIKRIIREKRTKPNITRYSFWNLGQTSVTHKAYEAAAATELSPGDAGWSQISGAGYNKIWYSDDDRHSKSVNVNLQYALLLFRFKIGTKPSVTKIVLSFEGYGTAPGCSGMVVRVWNHVTSTWELGFQTDATSEYTYEIPITDSIGNYIDDDGYLWLLARTRCTSDGITPAVIYCDYVEWVVTVQGITYVDVVSHRDEDQVDVKPVIWRTEFILKTWLFETVMVT